MGKGNSLIKATFNADQSMTVVRKRKVTDVQYYKLYDLGL